MAISTIRAKENQVPTFLVYLLGIIGIGLVVFFGGEVIRNFDNIRGKSGLTVETVHTEADVYLNDKLLGKTPYEADNIKPGTNKITLKNGTTQYQTTIDFLPNNKDFLHVVGIVRDLGTSDVFSSGQEFWFEKEDANNTLRIISEPLDATVYIDNNELGTTPFSSDKISDGDYELKIVKEGYEAQTARIKVMEGYTLNAKIKLFPYPVQSDVKQMDDSVALYDLSLSNPIVTSDTQAWTKAAVYWNQTRGINLGGTGENKERIFDYFIDYKGNIFDADANIINSTEELTNLEGAEKGAYLGDSSSQTGLTKEAKEAFEALSGIANITKQATVSSTPTGWLRVRDQPSLNSTQVTTVDSGGKYPILEESGDWIKIKVSESVEGWVSATYVSFE